MRGKIGTCDMVAIDRPGSNFEDAVDEVFAKIYGKRFHGTSGLIRWAIPDGRTGTPAHLIHAEKVLNDLSFETRPNSVEMLRS